ncbi:hypothetical protein EYF80_065960 [Liparis tanakae]|uniref:Uncharacterized protein n=1 Tax=Liparis tanakae TaxID=230148 RepID=A0A4Z2E5C5_9TELE|nr:hypothetical protein EYF80_065960 [Liparis tanakae]
MDNPVCVTAMRRRGELLRAARHMKLLSGSGMIKPNSLMVANLSQSVPRVKKTSEI